jgi:NADH-quinone oxidoreductase subunit E
MIKSEDKVETLSADVIKAINKELTKYPADQKKSAVMRGLWFAQQANGGWLTASLINAVADFLEIPRIAAFEVATFYTMYDLKPTGKNKIYVCTSISCMLNGADETLNYLKDKLQIDTEQTTTDGCFTLKTAQCLAACANAPMMQINSQYYENLTPMNIDQILAELKKC